MKRKAIRSRYIIPSLPDRLRSDDNAIARLWSRQPPPQGKGRRLADFPRARHRGLRTTRKWQRLAPGARQPARCSRERHYNASRKCWTAHEGMVGVPGPQCWTRPAWAVPRVGSVETDPRPPARWPAVHHRRRRNLCGGAPSMSRSQNDEVSQPRTGAGNAQPGEAAGRFWLMRLLETRIWRFTGPCFIPVPGTTKMLGAR